MEQILKQILGELREFKQEMTEFKQEMTEFKKDTMERFDTIENQQSENTRILRALEHSNKVNKAELDKLGYEVAEIKGDVRGIREDLRKVELITSSNWNDIVKLKSIR